MNNLSERPLVFVQGSFDDLRTLDIRFIQEAAQLGDVHVLLFYDQVARQITKKELKFPFEERRYYLQNIRYVSHLSPAAAITNDTISLQAVRRVSPDQQVIWAVREADASPMKAAFCQSNAIQYQVIPDSALSGFPLGNAIPDKQSTHKKVMVSGCFDWVHSGHVRFFEEVSQFGDLYVVVGHDENLRLLKGAGHPLFMEDERLYWVQSIRFVKQALISTGHGWLDAAPEVERIKPDIFVVNADGDVPEKRKYFSEMGIEYKILARKPKNGLPARVSTNLRGF